MDKASGNLIDSSLRSYSGKNMILKKGRIGKMSWYNEKLKRIINEQKKNLISPFAKDSIQGDNYLEYIVIIITNMQSVEDYNRISSELLALDGVKKVKRYLSKKIQVLYDTEITEAKQILDKLDEMGWQYIKRTCRNCGK